MIVFVLWQVLTVTVWGGNDNSTSEYFWRITSIIIGCLLRLLYHAIHILLWLSYLPSKTKLTYKAYIIGFRVANCSPLQWCTK